MFTKIRSIAELDHCARALWQDASLGRISAADAERAGEALDRRRSELAATKAAKAAAPVLGRPRGRNRRLRPKVRTCGALERTPLDRNAKARIMVKARALTRRTAKGRHYGAVTAKTIAVLEALLWRFHNAASGACFPSYEIIAEAAGCARSTVAAAVKMLEDAGILTWVNRYVRAARRSVRSSNQYQFVDPMPSKSEHRSGTNNPELTPLSWRPSSRLEGAIEGQIARSVPCLE